MNLGFEFRVAKPWFMVFSRKTTIDPASVKTIANEIKA